MGTETEPDDFSDIETKVSDAVAQKAREMAFELRKREANLKQVKDRAESDVDIAQKHLAQHRDEDMPAAFKGFGLNGIDVPDLGYVGVEDDVVGSLPSKEKRPDERSAALAYLEEIGHGNIIKRKMVALLPKDMPLTVDLQQVADVVGMLAALSAPPEEGAEVFTLNDVLERIIQVLVPGTSVSTDLDVPHQSLCSWARDLGEAGKDIDFRRIGIVAIKRGKISVSKSKAARRRQAKNI